MEKFQNLIFFCFIFLNSIVSFSQDSIKREKYSFEIKTDPTYFLNRTNFVLTRELNSKIELVLYNEYERDVYIDGLNSQYSRFSLFAAGIGKKTSFKNFTSAQYFTFGFARYNSLVYNQINGIQKSLLTKANSYEFGSLTKFEYDKYKIHPMIQVYVPFGPMRSFRDSENYLNWIQLSMGIGFRF